MPYFQAFLLETHRCANVVPNPVPRLAPKDWYLRGHRIPKVCIQLIITKYKYAGFLHNVGYLASSVEEKDDNVFREA